MQTVEAVLPREPAQCWRAFIDPLAFPAWIPGLRRAQVITTDADGLATEILFELGASRTYTLVYAYDVARLEVRWSARANKREAVAGFARFAAAGEGTHITYGLEGAAPAGDVKATLDAFVRWMLEARFR